MLEKRMRKRSLPSTPKNYEEQFRLFEMLSSRVLADVEQMKIIVNFVYVELTKKEEKRVRFTTL